MKVLENEKNFDESSDENTNEEKLNIKIDEQSVYPDLIFKMLNLCVKETNEIKGELAGRIRAFYKKVFLNYKDKMNLRDSSIINSGLNYIYDYSRIHPISQDEAEWVIGIHDIPISHIVSYTSKNILKQIAKKYNVPCSNKKSEEIVIVLREVMERN
jgi:hypothetical protein